MTTLFISFFTLILLLVSAFVVMIVLMQRSSNAGGMGGALGGGATEQVLGAETNSVLTKGTIYGTIAFFVIALGLHLAYLSLADERPVPVDAAALAGEENGAAATEEETFPAVEVESNGTETPEAVSE